jgi:DNA topoisomerase-1
MNLVIVESPAKAKTINKYLGNDFKVVASFGHIRDLPSKNGSVLPEENFTMKYEISEKSGKHVEEIIKLAAKTNSVYLATDPDREGEAISWHVIEVIKAKFPQKDIFFRRIAFNEITKKAINEALAHPRDIDTNLVNAQQARRALDYLVGFTLSPILWRKLPGCRSAGRVQSVALRLICERETEIESFKVEEYWDITLKFAGEKKEIFGAKLTHAEAKKLDKFSIPNEAEAGRIVTELKKQHFSVIEIERKQQKRTPPAPFITSSLQQEASRKLGFSAKKTMQIAQKLYEGINVGGDNIGLITYMRTDGVTLADEAINSIRTFIHRNFGDQYLPSKPNKYKSKAKNAQEAHEAIRPTDITLTPDKLRNSLDKDYLKLYELIWKRTIACQMENVILDIVSADIANKAKTYIARATGSTIKFDGFYKIYKEDFDDQEEAEENSSLPELNQGEELETKTIKPNQHFTQPPPRYSEASLVKKLEELGIGRPSTYASILSVLQDRDYVSLVKKRFVPEDRGRLVTAFLVGYFKKYVEYGFTADLENELDEVAEGKVNWLSLLKGFWDGFNDNITTANGLKITDVIKYVEESLASHLFGSSDKNSRACPSCKDGELNLKLGKYGAFLACSNYPDCNFKKQISSAENQEGINAEEGETPAGNTNRTLGKNTEGTDIQLKKGPYGWYIQVGEAQSKTEKPKRVPLPAGIDPSTLDLDLAIKIAGLPLTIGHHSGDDKEITLGIGKFGPYLKHDGKFVSIPKKINPFSVDLNEAMDIIQKASEKKSSKK